MNRPPELPQPTANPWQTIRSERVYDNPWISVTQHDVLTPGGSEGIYGVVHYKHLAIGIIPLFPNGDTLLVGQYRYPLERYSWEIIEGGGKLLDAPVVSAQRELKEETGLSAQRYTEFLRMHLSNSVSDELAILYYATGLTQGTAQPDDTEDLKLRRVALRDAIELVHSGAITDSMSVAGLLALETRLLKGQLSFPEQAPEY